MEALVDSIMRKKPEAVDPDLTVTKAAAIIAKRSEQCLIVARDDIVVGIVTSTDMIEKVIAVGANPAKVYVRDIMSTPVITVNVTATIGQAAEIIKGRHRGVTGHRFWRIWRRFRTYCTGGK